MNFIQPKIDLTAFTCPYCNTLAQQEWRETAIAKYHGIYHGFSDTGRSNSVTILKISTCKSCEKFHLWVNEKMLIPNISTVPLPNEDMPEQISAIYLEAREIANQSPKAAAALLRLALQLLCKELGGSGRDINADIGKFVKEGLDIRVQQSLDIVRVTGNNAVHPGTLALDDNPDIVYRLFGLLNYVVDALITQPKLINAFFDELPSGAKGAIEERDKK